MFIVFEGIDGSGKSTQAELLREYLTDKGLAVLALREPGGTAVGERIREILLHKDDVELDIRTELLLFMASRAQLTAELILPAVEAGTAVICDRYLYSSLAYQCGGGGLDREDAARIGAFATQQLEPDIVFFIDVPVDTGFSRVGSGQDRMESRGSAYFQRVRDSYAAMAAARPDLFRTIDGSPDAETVFSAVKESIDDL